MLPFPLRFRELKKLLGKYGIKPSPVIKRALEDEVKRLMLGEVEKKVKKVSGKIT